MRFKGAVWAAVVLVSTIGTALAQDLPLDNGLEEARQRGHALKEAYLARGAEMLDYGYNDSVVTVRNRGSEAVVIVACEDRCTKLDAELRVEGLPLVRRQSERGEPRLLEFPVPADHIAAHSDWRMSMNARCRGGTGSCDAAWWVLALSPAPPLEQRGGPSVLTDAEWDAATDLPDGVQMTWAERFGPRHIHSLYPPGPLRRSVEGRVALRCVVIEGGLLRCRPESETPAGQGFAEAALRLSSFMRAEATDTAGQPVLGRRVNLPLRFLPQ